MFRCISAPNSHLITGITPQANSTILGLALLRLVSVAPLRGIFPPGFPLSGCFPIFVPSYFYSYWIPTLIFESILFVLMAINFVQHARVHKNPVPILVQFFRDGTVFYAVIFATLLIQVLLYELVNSALAQVAIAWELTIFSVAGSRLILNLRASAVAGSNPGMGLETLEMIKFDKNPQSPSVQLDSFATAPGPGGLRFNLPSGSDLASGSNSRSGISSSGYGTSSEGHGEKERYVLGMGSVGSVGSDGTYLGREKGLLMPVPENEAEAASVKVGEEQARKEERRDRDVEAARPNNAVVADPDDWMAEWGKLML